MWVLGEIHNIKYHNTTQHNTQHNTTPHNTTHTTNAKLVPVCFIFNSQVPSLSINADIVNVCNWQNNRVHMTCMRRRKTRVLWTVIHATIHPPIHPSLSQVHVPISQKLNITWKQERENYSREEIGRRCCLVPTAGCMHVGWVGPTGPCLSHRDFRVEGQKVGPLLSQNLLRCFCLSPPLSLSPTKHSIFGPKAEPPYLHL